MPQLATQVSKWKRKNRQSSLRPKPLSSCQRTTTTLLQNTHGQDAAFAFLVTQRQAPEQDHGESQPRKKRRKGTGAAREHKLQTTSTHPRNLHPSGKAKSRSNTGRHPTTSKDGKQCIAKVCGMDRLWTSSLHQSPRPTKQPGRTRTWANVPHTRTNYVTNAPGAREIAMQTLRSHTNRHSLPTAWNKNPATTSVALLLKCALWQGTLPTSDDRQQSTV